MQPEGLRHRSQVVVSPGRCRVSFSTDLAKLVSDQLAQFVTLNRHQLAGHGANLDFWLGEVRQCLEVIDGYKKRFERMRAAQAQHVEAHKTTEWRLGET